MSAKKAGGQWKRRIA